jgi:hemerythrin
MARSEIEWSPDFLIGIEELDFEHKTLIENINRLHRKLASHDDIDEIRDTMGDIHVHMQSHFALEEHLMLENDYPHYIEHKAEHNKLLDMLIEQMVKFGSASDTVDTQAVEDKLKHWIVFHIVNSDRKMSQMIRDDTDTD